MIDEPTKQTLKNFETGCPITDEECIQLQKFFSTMEKGCDLLGEKYSLFGSRMRENRFTVEGFIEARGLNPNPKCRITRKCPDLVENPYPVTSDDTNRCAKLYEAWSDAHAVGQVNRFILIDVIHALFDLGFTEEESKEIFYSKHIRWFLDEYNSPFLAAGTAREKFKSYVYRYGLFRIKAELNAELKSDEQRS